MTDVLHTLRCIGFAGLPRIAEASGLPEADAEDTLIDLARNGLLTWSPGDFGGWGLTDAGRAEDTRRTAAEVAASGAHAAITEAYHDFLVLNPELLDLCAAWQTTTAPRPRILDRLADLHQRATAVLGALVLPRFTRYEARLGHALARAVAGHQEYVTNSVDSYHAVWFQLHEDLLVTLGTPRHG